SFIGERPRGDQMVRLVSGVPAVLSGRMSAGDDSRQVRHTIHACAAMNTCYASRSYFMNLIVMNLSKHNARVNTHNAARDRRHSLKDFREGCLEAQPCPLLRTRARKPPPISRRCTSAAHGALPRLGARSR